MKTYIIGDVHGEVKKLESCLNIVNFDFNKDTLISLGDVVDRGKHSFECVELLLKCKNGIFIKGNHDDCYYQGLLNGTYLLYNQGCKETLQSYIKNCNPDRQLVDKFSGVSTDFCLEDIPPEHYGFFKNQLPYYIDKDNNCFVHGGFNRHHLIEETEKYGEISDLWWDRDLFMSALAYENMKDHTYPFKMKNQFKNVFIGHTPTQYWGVTIPIKAANIYNLDTGCGKSEEARLTILDLDTLKYYQSE